MRAPSTTFWPAICLSPGHIVSTRIRTVYTAKTASSDAFIPEMTFRLIPNFLSFCFRFYFWSLEFPFISDPDPSDRVIQATLIFLVELRSTVTNDGGQRVKNRILREQYPGEGRGADRGENMCIMSTIIQFSSAAL